MGWRIVKQPSGQYALFSEVVDTFTVIDMTRDEALLECHSKGCDVSLAHQKVVNADLDKPFSRDCVSRWQECQRSILIVHGPVVLAETLTEFDDQRDKADALPPLTCRQCGENRWIVADGPFDEGVLVCECGDKVSPARGLRVSNPDRVIVAARTKPQPTVNQPP